MVLVCFSSSFLVLTDLCGSFFIQWNYHYTSTHSNKSITENWVSITFDDGPDPPVFTPQALELLKKHNAKATFFCIGHKIEKNEALFQQILNEGHSIGNHTYGHSNSFGFYNKTEVIAELKKAISLVEKITGLTMNLYRPAFGVTNPSIAYAVKKLGLQSIGWNVRSLDTTVRTERMVLRRITSKVERGDVILLHDTSAKSIAVLEQLLVFLQEKNLQSVCVDQLLEIEAYATKQDC